MLLQRQPRITIPTMKMTLWMEQPPPTTPTPLLLLLSINMDTRQVVSQLIMVVVTMMTMMDSDGIGEKKGQHPYRGGPM
jgi:hypothetical protein